MGIVVLEGLTSLDVETVAGAEEFVDVDCPEDGNGESIVLLCVPGDQTSLFSR